MEEWGVGMPLHGRAAQPAELGPSFVFLASSADSNVMTGQILHVNSEFHSQDDTTLFTIMGVFLTGSILEDRKLSRAIAANIGRTSVILFMRSNTMHDDIGSNQTSLQRLPTYVTLS
jgi:hypothetical protein